MTKLYFLDLKDKGLYRRHTISATSKPRIDTEKILNCMGFKSLIISHYFYGMSNPSLLIRLLYRFKVIHFVNTFNIKFHSLKYKSIRDSIIAVQYPFLNGKMAKLLHDLSKRNKIILLFHDYYTYNDKGMRNYEEGIINSANVIVVHSEAMEKEFCKEGFKRDMVKLKFFDYLNKYDAKKEVSKTNINIVFAGNLEKSLFINQLPEITKNSKLNFLLYGKERDNLPINSHISYKGSFHNEDIEHVEGNWGLVWDGESVNTCEGKYGGYLRINAPFKLSLYLAMGIPVIVWSESAMADYVRQKKLGVAVASLKDVESTITALTPEEVEDIQQGVSMYSEKVKRGKMLEDAIHECLDILKNK